jgi:hypothetical protein
VDAFEGIRNNGAGVAGRDSGFVKGRADLEGLVWCGKWVPMAISEDLDLL